MRLIGSEREKEIREHLMEVNRCFSARSDFSLVFFQAMEKAGIAPELCYLLDWTPDQGEDFYWVLAPGPLVVELEVPRDATCAAEVVLEMQSLHDYRQAAPKSLKLVVLVALDLASQQRHKNNSGVGKLIE